MYSLKRLPEAVLEKAYGGLRVQNFGGARGV